jgi:uncharacterized SAM-dependent methyltransferase
LKQPIFVKGSTSLLSLFIWRLKKVPSTFFCLQMLHIDVLLSENQLAQEFLAALNRHELPEKFFYWFPTSVRAWLNLCSDSAYRNFMRSQTLLQTYAAAVASHLPQGNIAVVSLGAGQGIKDMLVLEQLRASGRTPHYVPFDASQALLEMACELAGDSGFSCRGVKADLANARHLAAVNELHPAAPRLVMILGNTLGAFDPPDYCARLARLLRPQDHLLVDGEIFNATATMSGYDNPLNRQFAFGPLRSLGLTEPEDGELRFESDVDGRKPGLYRVRKHFLAARDLALLIAGETIRWRAGERIEMNWSYKYAHETFLALLREGGMSPVAQYLSEDERFLMALARKAD